MVDTDTEENEPQHVREFRRLNRKAARDKFSSEETLPMEYFVIDAADRSWLDIWLTCPVVEASNKLHRVKRNLDEVTLRRLPKGLLPD